MQTRPSLNQTLLPPGQFASDQFNGVDSDKEGGTDEGVEYMLAGGREGKMKNPAYGALLLLLRTSFRDCWAIH